MFASLGGFCFLNSLRLTGTTISWSLCWTSIHFIILVKWGQGWLRKDPSCLFVLIFVEVLHLVCLIILHGLCRGLVRKLEALYRVLYSSHHSFNLIQGWLILLVRKWSFWFTMLLLCFKLTLINLHAKSLVFLRLPLFHGIFEPLMIFVH